MSDLEIVEAFCKKLPKVDLHVHLDGSLRPETLLEVVQAEQPKRGWTLEQVTERVRVPADCRSLPDYLRRFNFVYRFVQSPEVLERGAAELVEDSAAENIKYVEVRFCPHVHVGRGAKPQDLVEGVLRGLAAGTAKTGVRSALIICALREQESKASMELAELAIAYRHQGVVAFDLAGNEADFDAKKHYEAFDRVGEAGLARIAHAGEAAGPESIREAIEKLGAERIGHGTRLLGDPQLLRDIVERGIPLEVCPTSNVHTRAVANYDGHPVGRYLRQGLRITLNTDNRTVSNTTLAHEYARAWLHGELSEEEIRRILVAGVDAAFLPSEDKATMREEFRQAFDRLWAEATGQSSSEGAQPG